jgi:hypothetical protein
MKSNWKKNILNVLIVCIVVFVVGNMPSFASSCSYGISRSFYVSGIVQCSDGYREDISHLSWKEGITLMRERGLGFKEIIDWSDFCFQRYLDPAPRALDGFHRYFDIYFDVAPESANVVPESTIILV